MDRNKSQASTSSTDQEQAQGDFKLSKILKATNNFDESLKIGQGGFGYVYKGKLSNGVLVAIKRLNPDSSQGATEYLAEVKMCSNFRHPNLVSMIGYCNYQKDFKLYSKFWKPVYNDKEMILLYEYMPKGTLKDLLHKLGTPLSFVERLNICIDVARGLNYLHTAGTIHRDIKTSNILFDKNGVAKISDFGLSKAGTSERSASTVCTILKGSFGYLAPELSASGIVSRKSDVYSFGVVMFEVLFRKLVLDSNRNDIQRSLLTWVEESLRQRNLMDIVDSDIRDEVPSEFVNIFFRIAERCLRKSPIERDSMAGVLASLETLQNSFNPLQLVEISEGDSTSPSPDVKEYTYNDLKKATRGFSEELSIGGGSDSKVFLGWLNRETLAPSNHVYGIAVAVQIVTSESSAVNTDWPEEVNFLGKIDHSNIIRLAGRCIHGHRHLFVYEHMEKSLAHFIMGEEPFPWGTRLHVMIGVARAMRYMYETKGVLCHFKCNGILLDENFNAKIGSFGWAKHNPIKVGRGDRMWLNGVFGYLKPDYDTSTGHVMVKNDIHCFGLVLLETIRGRLIGSDDYKDFLEHLELLVMQTTDVKTKERKLKKIMDPRLKGSCCIEGVFKCLTLVLRCISKNQEDKPSREDIVQCLEETASPNE